MAKDAATGERSSSAGVCRPRSAIIFRTRHDRCIADTLARIVINERTGTIVATSTVRLSHVAIASGSLTITVTSNVGVSQPNAFNTAARRWRFPARKPA